MMENVLKEIEGENEDNIRQSFRSFNEENASNYKLGESLEVRKNFCSVLLSKFSEPTWSPDTLVLALSAFKIFTRENQGASQLTTSEGLTPLLHLAGLDVGFAEMKVFFENHDIHNSIGQVNVIVEAVKCLCNLVLNNQPLADTVSELGCLAGLRARLTASTTMTLPKDVLFFDLRLLFLITACGPYQRVKLRDDHHGLSLVVTLLDSVLFGPQAKKGAGSDPAVQSQYKVAKSQVVGDVTVKKVEGAEMGEKRDSRLCEEASEESSTITTTSRTIAELISPSVGTRAELSADDEETCKGVADLSLDKDVGSKLLEEEEPQDDSEKASAAAGDVVMKPKSQRRLPRSPACAREKCFVLRSPVTDEMCAVLCESLKIAFNQTVNWKPEEEFDDDEVDLFFQLAHLVRIMICSIPLLRSKASSQTITHCCEVLMNIPKECHHVFLLPPDVNVTPKLRLLYPSLHPQPPDEEEGEADIEILVSPPVLDLDQLYDHHNVAVAVCLLNFLTTKLISGADKIDQHGLSIVVGALSLLCKGNRIFRRFLKSKILPPLLEVKERPESGTSLKGRLVRLMTAGSHDCTDMVAEFLFILCKESASRVVRHTGYGNSAGLLMSHGLLGGGRSQSQDNYSSDSEGSDTEEYQKCRETLDPVTGGPAKPPSESPLDHMTMEEIEEEAEKLGHLLERLEKQGDFKMVPIGKDNKPVQFPPSKPADHSSDED